MCSLFTSYSDIGFENCSRMNSYYFSLRKAELERTNQDCPVCLEAIVEGQEFGTPEFCRHRFCVGCIAGWARREESERPTCPMCRREFNYLYVRCKVGGGVIRTMLLDNKKGTSARRAIQDYLFEAVVTIRAQSLRSGLV